MFGRSRFAEWGPPAAAALRATTSAREALLSWRDAADAVGARAVVEEQPAVLQAFANAHADSVRAVAYWTARYGPGAYRKDQSNHAVAAWLENVIHGNDYVYLGRTARAHIRSSSISLGADAEAAGDKLFARGHELLNAIISSGGRDNDWARTGIVAAFTVPGLFMLDEEQYERLLRAHFDVTGLQWSPWKP